MGTMLYAVVNGDGTCLKDDLYLRDAVETLLTLYGHDFDVVEDENGILHLAWGPVGLLRPTGIRHHNLPGLRLSAASRREPWNGRCVASREVREKRWWRLEQPGRQPFYFDGVEKQEAYDYCQYLNRQIFYKNEVPYEVREVTDEVELARAALRGSRSVKPPKFKGRYRTAFLIDNRQPAILRDLIYPDRLFEFTSKIFLSLSVRVETGMYSRGFSIRVRIADNFAQWDQSDWRRVIENALRNAGEIDLGEQAGGSGSPTTLVSLRTAAPAGLLLWRHERGIVDEGVKIDTTRLKNEIRRRIESVPESGRTDCMRQAALSEDHAIEIKCRSRKLHPLQRGRRG